MSTEPDKIYLHDPHGVFDEDGHNGLETVTWSEDRIDENDYEYVRLAVLGDVRAIYDELLEELMYLYQHYPNNFRKTPKEYFIKEKEMQKKLSELFA